MIAAIRIKGRFSLPPKARFTLESMRLIRLHSCAIVPANPSSLGMLQAAKDVISFGEISKEALSYLLSKRGKSSDGRKLSALKKPAEIAKMADELFAGKTPSELGVLPVFFLSPPKGGYGARKMQPPFGPTGKNPSISALVMSMA